MKLFFLFGIDFQYYGIICETEMISLAIILYKNSWHAKFICVKSKIRPRKLGIYVKKHQQKGLLLVQNKSIKAKKMAKSN